MGDLVGQIIGVYRIIKKLGRGGFGEVYLAENIYDKEILVAFKIAIGTSSEEARRTFFNEARIIHRLDHPHIVKLLEFGLYVDLPYLVMNYIEQGSLRERYPKGTKLDLHTIIHYVKQIAGALQYAHDYHNKDVNGIVHRDIKPNNILLKNDNTLLVSDFGIATLSYTRSYRAQEAMGDLPYMSPEQFLGEAQSASDQYSLAIMVYEWLCGFPPFIGGKDIQMHYLHRDVPPSPLHDIIAILPAVEEVVMKALAKDPKQRYASVTEFAQALEGASKFPGESYYPAHVAQAIRECYLRSKEIANALGKPIPVNESDIEIRSHRGTVGYVRPFTNGAIYWCERGGAQPIDNVRGFANLFNAWNGVDGKLGFPLSDVDEAAPSPQGSTGIFQRFEGEEDYPEDVNTPPIRCGATTYWRRGDEHVHVVMGKIGECYERLYGTCSFLGFPISREENIGPFEIGSIGRCQYFEGGSIYRKEGSSEAFPIGKDVGELYHNKGDVRFRLGFPIAKASKTIISVQGTAGKYQRFEGGPSDSDEGDHSKGVRVYWSKKYGAYPVWGGIGVCYERHGAVNSLLGFPTANEKIAFRSPQGTEGWYQSFEGGSIHWCEQHKGVPITGSIHKAYMAFGGSRGKFGFPKAQQKAVPGQPDGSYTQEFEGGVIGVYAG